ncbi:hypothetical protein ABFS82_04G019200 [Erythranthe guttata]|uniref:translocase of chloroplast 159, chloroplastic n=1 Tax=Erythranthe guttata TaxID=4155 RepID=UPI00064E1434|nr:PREDICTED: translocase of chloroplast 159, chloroplastic [Erythranthe guttata]|eukprot:XP_012833140.1 PREDICTED: translocase of chloroplast 159, chloroplastic [Erythranthe guttata]
MDSKEATTQPISEVSSGDSRSDSKGTVPEDEGYVSGNEEFEPASDKLVVDEIVEEENSDELEKIESLLISGVVVNDDDDVEKGDKDIEGGGVLEGDKVGGVEGFDRNGEVLDSVEKLGVNSNDGVDGEEGKVGVREAEMKVEESEVNEKSEPQAKDASQAAVVEHVESEFSDAVDVKTTPEGDAVVDAIQVDVAAPGVVVVGETEEDGDAGNEPEKEVISEVAVIEQEKSEVVSLVNEGQTSQGDPVAVDETEPKEENLTSVDKLEPKEVAENVGLADVALASEGDSVVDAIQVDKVGPGVVVVGELEGEKIEGVEVPLVSVSGPTETADDVEEVGTREVLAANIVDVVDADENSDAVGVVDLENGVHASSESNDSVDSGDTIKKPEVEFESPRIPDSRIAGKARPIIVGINNLEVEGGGEPESAPISEAVENSTTPKIATDGEVEGEVNPRENTGKAPPVVIGRSSPKVEEDVEYESAPISEVAENSITAKIAADGEVEGELDGLSNTVTVPPVVIEPNNLQVEDDVEYESAPISEAVENSTTAKTATYGEVEGEAGDSRNTGTAPPVVIGRNDPPVEDDNGEEVNPEDSMSDEDSDGMIFGSSEAAKKFIEELERESVEDSHAGGEGSLHQSRGIDGQIVTDSEEEEEEEEGETDEEGDGKELFDNAALAALLKAASRAESDGGSITITSQDGSRLFSVERPAGLGSSLQSLRPAQRPNRPSLFGTAAPSAGGGGGGEVEDRLSDEEKKKLEKLQEIRVKFLRLVHRLGLSPEESVAAQVLYRLALLGGRQSTHTFNLDAAKRTALLLEAGGNDDLDFSINILVLGKSGVGKSATINSVFGEEKAPIDAFETGTASAREISGLVDGVKVRVIDTPGLKSSVMEQSFNRGVLSSVKKFTKKSPPDVVLYVDRLDAQSRDLNDLPLLKTITSSLNSSIWRSAIVTLTHAASAPPDGPSGAPLSYDVFVSQRSHVVQQSIGHAVGDLRMMSPSLMNPVSLVENHPSCRKNRDGHKILPNGQIWRPQLLLLCYSMKILSEASSLSKPQDPFDHRKLFGMRQRAPPLPYMLSSMLQTRTHPKLQSDQGGDSVDSDIDLDEDLSDDDQEGVDEYDQLPPFKPLKKAQMAKLTAEQRKAYFEEYDYRVKLLQKKQWREELKRMREMKKNGGKDAAAGDYAFAEDDADAGAAAPIAVPLPDMALPPSFDGDNPAYRFRFLEPTSQFLARPVLDNHGWDHDCGYDGVNLEHSLAIASRFPAVYTVQVTKDKKDFSISLDSSVSAKYGDDISTMAGFDIQSMGKQLAYIFRGEAKIKNLKKHRATGGLSFTLLGENVVPGVKIEDQISLGKQYSLSGSAGAVRSQQDTAYGANFELQRRELDYPIGQVQSTLSVSVVKWRGDLALGLNSLAQFSLGRNSKVAVRAGINNKLSGQITVRTSSSEHLSLALTAIIPTVLSVYKKFFAGGGEKYPIY